MVRDNHNNIIKSMSLTQSYMLRNYSICTYPTDKKYSSALIHDIYFQFLLIIKKFFLVQRDHCDKPLSITPDRACGYYYYGADFNVFTVNVQ